MAEYINGKLQLPNVTLVAMTSVNVRATYLAMKYSMKDIDFGDAVLITHRRPLTLPWKIRYSHTKELTNINDFNYKMVYELTDHIKTDYALIVHADGFVVNPKMWRDEFLDYDYVGAPWPLPPSDNPVLYRAADGTVSRVGNSAGIRSKRLLDYPKVNNIPWEGYIENGQQYFHEDIFLCCHLKPEMEKVGIKIAPIDVAKYYAHEHAIDEVKGITPFAFHKWWGANDIYPDFTKTDYLCKLETFMMRVKRKLRRTFLKKYKEA